MSKKETKIRPVVSILYQMPFPSFSNFSLSVRNWKYDSGPFDMIQFLTRAGAQTLKKPAHSSD